LGPSGRWRATVCCGGWWGGYALFILTEYSVWIAMLVYAYSRGGATIAGLVALAQLVPAALLAPVFAALADRRSPVVLLAGGYLVQAAGMGATAVAIAGGMPLAAYAAAVVASTAVTATRPAQSTLIPSLAVTPDQHHRDQHQHRPAPRRHQLGRRPARPGRRAAAVRLLRASHLADRRQPRRPRHPRPPAHRPGHPRHPHHHAGRHRDHHRQRLNPVASRGSLARYSAAAPTCWLLSICRPPRDPSSLLIS